MAVVLRLSRVGKKVQPFYRIVAADKIRPRDGKFIEIIGTFNPKTDPPTANFREDRIRRWISAGAKPSSVVRALIKRSFPGLIEQREEHQLKKIQEKRRSRKTRTKGAKKAAKRAAEKK